MGSASKASGQLEKWLYRRYERGVLSYSVEDQSFACALLFDLADISQIFQVGERFGNGHATRLAVVPAMPEELLGDAIGVLWVGIKHGQYLRLAFLVVLDDLPHAPGKIVERLAMPW